MVHYIGLSVVIATVTACVIALHDVGISVPFLF